YARHVVGPGEAVLRQHLPAPVDQQRQPHPRVAHEDPDRFPERVHELAEVPAYHGNASATRWASNSRSPSCAPFSATITRRRSPAPMMMTWPAPASTCTGPIAPSPAFSDAAAAHR